ncbi:putative MFS-type transporter [Smittium mucronatum]|uniref:Putative MFS-type transporter n=1 Tax=Smittium mucronatum TaxID=133383 RepID=A0A1R0H8Q1_9FUNG|nr:putative MFS-type transporter [Smittium mucronatum]
MLGILLFSVVSGQLVAKIGAYRPFVWAGFVALSLASYAFYIGSKIADVGGYIVIIFIVGACIGICAQPSVIAIRAASPQTSIHLSTTMVRFFRIVGGILGPLVFSSIFNNTLSSHLKNLLVSDPQLVSFAGTASTLPPLMFSQQLATTCYLPSLRSAFIAPIVSSLLGLVASLGIGHYKLPEVKDTLPTTATSASNTSTIISTTPTISDSERSVSPPYY